MGSAALWALLGAEDEEIAVTRRWPDLGGRQRAQEKHAVSVSLHISEGNCVLPNLSGLSGFSCFFQSLESTRRMLQLVEEVRTAFYLSFCCEQKRWRLTHWEVPFSLLLTVLGHGHGFLYHSVPPHPTPGRQLIWDTMPQLPSIELQASRWGMMFCPYLSTHRDRLLEIRQGSSFWRWPGVRDKQLSLLQSSWSLVLAPPWCPCHIAASREGEKGPLPLCPVLFDTSLYKTTCSYL